MHLNDHLHNHRSSKNKNIFVAFRDGMILKKKSNFFVHCIFLLQKVFTVYNADYQQLCIFTPQRNAHRRMTSWK